MIECICKICGNVFNVIPSRIKNSGGKYCSDKCRIKSLKTKSNCICLECGIEFYLRQSRIKKGWGKYCSKECRIKNQNGNKNPNWRGGKGKSPSNYCSKFNEICKKSNRDKFNNQCFLCGLNEKDNIVKTGKQYKLSVHHVDHNKQQGCNSDWKLVPLCIQCHAKVGSIHNKDFYEQLLSTLIYIRETLKDYNNKIDYRSLKL